MTATNRRGRGACTLGHAATAQTHSSEKLRPVPTPMPDDDDEEEEEGGGSISVAKLHPMPIDSGFLCKKHRTEESFPTESIYFGGNLTWVFSINTNVKPTPSSLINSLTFCHLGKSFLVERAGWGFE